MLSNITFLMSFAVFDPLPINDGETAVLIIINIWCFIVKIV